MTAGPMTVTVLVSVAFAAGTALVRLEQLARRSRELATVDG